MKTNTAYLFLFLIVTVMFACAVAIDWDILNPKYWSGIMMTLIWATLGVSLLHWLANTK